MFRVSIITPANLSDPGLAIATARAGATVFFDIEFCPQEDMQQVEDNMLQTMRHVPESATLGLRFGPNQAYFCLPLLAKLATRPHGILLTGWAATSAAKTAAFLPPCDGRALYLEVIDPTQVDLLDQLGISVTGFIAKGHECGGWVGESSAFILAQQVLNKTPLPVHVQGGIGPQTAAACLAAGAAGVVLDDQLWLMPESPFPAKWKAALASVNGSETIVCGRGPAGSARVLSRPGFAGADKLRRLADEDNSERWREKALPLIGWGDPASVAWPMGQAVGMAARFVKKHRTAGRLVRAISETAASSLRRSAALNPLGPDSALARSHGTKYPIVQGPMTRVSDVALFAQAVAKAGGLPMFALALLRQSQANKLLRECKELMDGLSWGVGILGFVPPEVREEQLAVIREIRPPFALVAGGRPEHAAELENHGIATYLHVPTPELLELFVARGSRRFVFEGRECGGHIGPLTSFCLWESMIEVLLAVPKKTATEFHVLFAGGIHDARSAAMVAALSAPLAERGVKVGVLMGTAYLFTEEAVKCGAIVPRFQQEALKCERTVCLETGIGHIIRCMATPFTEEFELLKRQLGREGDNSTVARKLEEVTLGRLRVASKGMRREGEQLVELVDSVQYQEGLYMVGLAATMRSTLTSIESLHAEVSQQGAEALSEAAGRTSPEPAQPNPCDIAIIGMSALMPGANDPEVYWRNILNKTNSIQEIPPHRWDWRIYYDPNRATPDKFNSRWGGFLDEIAFDPLRYGIPPNSLKATEPIQLLALETTRRALEDAGYENGGFDRERTAVFFGVGSGMGELAQKMVTRCEMPRTTVSVDPEVWDRLPEWSGRSMPGVLSNIVSGRVANRFDLGGTNYVVDAACASSLAALEQAVRQLEAGDCEMALAGGADAMQSPFAYMGFSKTHALSPKGTSRPFDEKADGIVLSEAVGVLVLKRLADAERDGDRVYAVIKGIGSSSDGRSVSMTAPATTGQMRAMRRAYQKAGISPSSIGYYEAHGTGTSVGDRIELDSYTALLKESSARPKSCAIGSVKSLIGHAKGAAGTASLVKTALALHNKVLPPHGGVENPLPALRQPDSPTFLAREPLPWLAGATIPRRAALSAFGFGGTNFHVVLEEYGNEVKTRPQGGQEWPCELFTWRSKDRESLRGQLADFLVDLQKADRSSLREISFSLLGEASQAGGAALALVASTKEELADIVRSALAQLENPTSLQPNSPFALRLDDAGIEPRGKVAFLFPGQGAQYPYAAREAALFVSEIAESVEAADRAFDGLFEKRLSDFIFPPSAFSEDEQKLAVKQLSQTNVAQPAIGALSCGYLDFLSRLGLAPDLLAGHSYGEYTALHAAGVLSRAEFLRLSSIRGQTMESACRNGSGGMAAVAAAREDVANRIAGTPLVVANHNGPRQTVISGPIEVLKRVLADLEKDGVSSTILPVTGAFHSPLLQEAQRPLAEAIAAAKFLPPRRTVFSNVTGQAYGSDPEAIRRQLTNHMLSPVEFVAVIEAMYRAGARFFIEVGPRGVLSSLVVDILRTRDDAVILALDSQRGGLRGLLHALGRLYVEGLEFDLRELFAGRVIEAAPTADAKPDSRREGRHWLLSGAGVRRPKEAPGLAGKIAPLNQAGILKAAHPATASPSSSNQQAELMISPKEPSPESYNQRNGQSQNRSDATALEAYADYQKTMRQFLAMEEEVMKQFLATEARAASLPKSVVVEAKKIAASPGQAEEPAPVISPFVQGSSISGGNGSSALQLASTRNPELEESALADADSPSYGRDELTKKLLDLVGERTGYPPEMLGLDQDLEADLGIDSIKRVEIIGAFQDLLPPVLMQKLTQEDQDITRVRTLNGWLDVLAAPASETTNR